MAGPYYVRSTDGSDASDGLTWANAKATLVGALAVAAAGERIWVSQVHAETQTTEMALTSAGTAASPIDILCGNDGAEPPTALATTATVTVTSGGNINFAGFAYSYGLSFSVGTLDNNRMYSWESASPWAWTYEQCVFTLNTTHPNPRYLIGNWANNADDQRIRFVNSKPRFGATTQAIECQRGFIEFIGGAAADTGTVPTTLFKSDYAQAAQFAVTQLRGVDLSAFGSGKNLVAVSSPGIYVFSNCKLGASVAVTTGTNPGQGGPLVWLDNCDSADTQYRMQRHQYEGDVYSETTVVRTGGASDGTTPLAHKMVSSANAKFSFPLYGPEMVIWNDAVGSSQTVTCEILHDSVTNLQDDEVWLETEYLGTSGFPLSLFANDRAADILATPADQAASSETWTTTGMTNPNKQKLVTTQTPQEKGWYRCRVALAKASYTVYACPKLAVA